MGATIYIEGGGDAKDLHVACRKAFRSLLEKLGFAGRMPRLVACGSRNDAYDDFCTAHMNTAGKYIALLVDSEDALHDEYRTWNHLYTRDGWIRPVGADDEQILFMTTCMETWIAADRQALHNFFGQCLQESALPALLNIEKKNRHDVQKALENATGRCKKKYKKGNISFELMQKVAPATIHSDALPSFRRMVDVLEQRL